MGDHADDCELGAWDEEWDSPELDLYPNQSPCDAFTSNEDLVERARSLDLPDNHFLSKLMVWWYEHGFFTQPQRSAFVQVLHREEQAAGVTVQVSKLSNKEVMPNLIIPIPEEVATMLQKALDDRYSEGLVIKTRDIKLELTKEGKLTSCEFSNFQIVGEPVEVIEPEPQPTPEPVTYSRPQLVREVIDEQKVEEPKAPLQLVIPEVNPRTTERREALIKLIRSSYNTPLRMYQMATALTEQGFPCVPSTVSGDINFLLKAGRVSFYHQKGAGRVYKVIEPGVESFGF